MVTQQRDEKIQRVMDQRQKDVIVVLEDIHDPHNAAAILRSCDAFGIGKVYYVFEKEEAYDPKKIGKASSATANKWIDIEIFSSTNACITKLEESNFTSIATALTENAESLLDATFPEERLAIWVGNEHQGLSEEAIAHADRTLIIPMLGMVQSLNVSVATSIVLWEIVRQKRES